MNGVFVSYTKSKGRFIGLTALVLFIAISQLFLSGAAGAQNNHCDPYLEMLAGTPYGYSDRGTRCEGLYIKDISTMTLFLASLAEFLEDYDLDSGKDLLVEWEAPCESSVHLRAEGLRRRLYYRMDTAQPAKSTSYSWPSDILGALRISRQDIGVVGWTSCSVGGEDTIIYLPLRITQRKKAKGERRYKVVVLPGQELEEVYITVAPLGPDGRLDTPLRDGAPLGYGYYPAGRRVSFEIDDLQASGIYYLEIGATLRAGGSSTLEAFFYHPGR